MVVPHRVEPALPLAKLCLEILDRNPRRVVGTKAIWPQLDVPAENGADPSQNPGSPQVSNAVDRQIDQGRIVQRSRTQPGRYAMILRAPERAAALSGPVSFVDALVKSVNVPPRSSARAILSFRCAVNGW